MGFLFLGCGGLGEMVKPYIHDLVFLMTGSFVVWFFTRKRSLKDETTHFERDFRFYRNYIVGAIVIVSFIFFLAGVYDYFNESEYERMMREFRESRKN